MPYLDSQKKIASELMKCGVSRIRIKDDVEANKAVEEALTRNDIKILIRKGNIFKVRKKGSSNAYSKKRRAQKKRGRRKGEGSRKGTEKARSPPKKEWIKTVRTLRVVLKNLKENEQISGSDYRKLYLKVKGGSFRNKTHFLYYLKDHEFIKSKPRIKKVKKVVKKPEPKAVKTEGVMNEKKK